MISTTAIQTRPLPTAPRLPIVGALPYLVKRPFQYLQEAQQQHGDIFRIDLGLTSVVALTHPRHVQYILRDNVRNYRKDGNMWASARKMFGNGLVTSEGEFWLRQRRMMQPHFHRRHLAALFDLMLTAIDDQMTTWPDAAEAFDLSTAVNNITMQVIVRTMFGAHLSPTEFEQAGAAMTDIMNYILVGTIAESLPEWVPAPGKRRFLAARDTFDAIVYRVIEQCRADQNSVGLLPMLLNTVDAETGEQMSDQQLRDEVATIFVAGYETTAIAMAWAADYLARDQILQQRIADEVTAVIGQSSPDLKSLRDLDLVKRTFQETLRIRPSAWQLPRLVVADDEIDGVHIPAGTQVALLINQIHHHPDFWHKSEQFDPDRFLDKTPGNHPFAYVPFGAGQRQCIGRDFAYMEGQLILARILQKYRLHPVSSQPARPQLSSTLRPKGSVHIQLERLS